MLIIIEGIDRSGKTTLATAINKKFGYDYVHSGKPGSDPATEYATFLLNMDHPIIMDRFYLGELVYGPLLRGTNLISPLQLTVIERLCRLRGTILIQSITDVTLANQRLAEEKGTDITNQHNIKAAKAFDHVVKQANMLVLKYDGSTLISLDKMLQTLTPLVDVHKNIGLGALKVCTGIGTPVGPKLVFVGEAVNQRATWLNLPFDKGFSSQFLLDSFKAANVPEDKVYIVNADTLESPEVDFLSRDKALFISLGKKADARLSFLDVPHAVLPHPQYVKRFQWKNKGQYVKDLRDITKGF